MCLVDSDTERHTGRMLTWSVYDGEYSLMKEHLWRRILINEEPLDIADGQYTLSPVHHDLH